MRVHTYVYAPKHVHTLTYSHVHTHTHTRTQIHTHADTRTHTETSKTQTGIEVTTYNIIYRQAKAETIEQSKMKEGSISMNSQFLSVEWNRVSLNRSA